MMAMAHLSSAARVAAPTRASAASTKKIIHHHRRENAIAHRRRFAVLPRRVGGIATAAAATTAPASPSSPPPSALHFDEVMANVRAAMGIDSDGTSPCGGMVWGDGRNLGMPVRWCLRHDGASFSEEAVGPELSYVSGHAAGSAEVGLGCAVRVRVQLLHPIQWTRRF
jgi:hypothetical protein